MRVKIYVGIVAVVALVVALVTAALVPAWREPDATTTVLLIALVVVAESLQLRYQHHHTVDALVLLEGTFAPVIFAASGGRALTIIGAGILVAELVRRNQPIKRLFNIAQWILAASAGILVWHALDAGHDGSNAVVGALTLSLLAVVAVNQLLISGVLTMAAGHPLGSRDRGLAWTVAYGRLASLLGAIVMGLMLTASYLWHPWTVGLVIAPIVFLYGAGRAQASLRADHARLEGLQRATHSLVASLEPADAIPLFLAEARLGFEVPQVDLVLFGERGPTVHVCDGPSRRDYSVTTGRHELAELLSTSLDEPVHLSASGSDPASLALAAGGHQRALAAPLRAGSTTIGVLLLLDRIGIEGFESGELPIAAALARELVGFLERVELLAAVEGERRKLADILENTSDGILSIAADGTITSWNAGLTASTGYAAEEMVGTRHFGLLRPRDAGGRDVRIESWVEQIDGPNGLPQDLQIATADGQAVWLSCSYSRIPAGEDTGDVLVVVARNITQARELERLKDDFVAVVSHELRTPLVPIKGWAQTLLNRGDRLSDDQRRTAVQSILAQAQKLESLVLNILEASRIEAGRADGDGVADVSGIVVRLVEDSLAARPDREVRLRPASVPVTVRGSAIWVERAVSNLLANAIKYSPDDEPVDVVITTDGDQVLVAVTDRGPGIAADAQERIFERFERLEETRKQTGTGLGLYITRRLARAMGGEVSVSSVPGAGSTFLLRLPMAPASTGTSPRFPEQREAPRAVNVVNLR